MATIQVVMDDALLERLDRELRGVAKGRGRSALVREAIERELRRRERQRLDELDQLGYLEPPTDAERAEAAAWERAADWGEPWDPKPR
jgi:metal-responsive CopG/Arc/MetJ family transcriptional regulator